MEQILIFVLHGYFIAILSVSTIAKLDCIQCFAETLKQQNILPPYLTSPSSRMLPVIEGGLAYLLASGLMPKVSAVGLFLLFSTFLIMEVVLYRAKSSADCGCFGDARHQTVGLSSVIVSSILMVLTAINLSLVVSGVQINSSLLQAILFVSFLASSAFLLYKLSKRKMRERILRQETLRYMKESSAARIGMTA